MWRNTDTRTMAPNTFLLALLLLLGIRILHAEVRNYDFILKEKEFTRLCSTKSILVVNGSYPGPTLNATKGDILYVNVHNQANYRVTIHWHGVNNPRNPWFDGPEYITQCGILPGTNFTYQIILSEEEGTLWWHAHNDWTRWSVHGAIVIRPIEGTTYPFPKSDRDKLIVLGSWYTENVREEVEEDTKTGEDLPISEAYAINGELGDFSSCQTDTAYKWTVEYGKTYLLRLLNAAMNAELFFSIANHTLKVVGTDGAYLKPFDTNYVVISPGQTIDVLVTTDQNLGRYYMAARQFYTDKTIFTGFNHFNATAIVEYDGSYAAETPSFPSEQLPLYFDSFSAVEMKLKMRSLASEQHPIKVPTNITTRMFITTSLNSFFHTNNYNDTIMFLASSVNNISWTNPTTDVLLAYYKNLSGVFTTDFPDMPPSLFDFTSYSLPIDTVQPEKGTRVKVVDYNEQVEIVFQGTNVLNASENHPIHLHGHSFYTVGMGVGNFNNISDPQTFNLIDPPYQNTASLPKNGWMVIRFVANNPGVWLWHCHLARHLTWGMNSVFLVRGGGTEETSIRNPPAYMPPCRSSSDIFGSNEM